MKEDAQPLLDRLGHTPSCPSFNPGLTPAVEERKYVDLFCNCHKWNSPKVLSNSTDIAWPTGWTERQAAQWREKNGLGPPEA